MDHSARGGSASRPGRTGWWRRHQPWIVPAFCLAFCVLFFVGVFGVGWFVLDSLGSCEPCRQAVARAEGSPAVQAALGTPIRKGSFVTGSLSTNGSSSGLADLTIRLSGPKGKATLSAVATLEAGVWTFQKLEAEVAGYPERIGLLPAEAATAEATAETPADAASARAEKGP